MELPNDDLSKSGFLITTCEDLCEVSETFAQKAEGSEGLRNLLSPPFTDF